LRVPPASDAAAASLFRFFEHQERFLLTTHSSKGQLARSNPVLLACAGMGKSVVVEATVAAAAPLWKGLIFVKTLTGRTETLKVDSNMLMEQVKDFVKVEGALVAP
jgi:hypothetical protein